MSDKKQSSVDILCQKLANKLGLQAITFYIDHHEEIAQAKAMHKEEIIETARYYFHERGKMTPQKYYNETFGGQDNE